MTAVDGILLVLYAALVIVVGIAGVRARLRGSGARLPLDLDRHPIDVAYLGGGGERAVHAAVSAMYVCGRVAVQAGERAVPAARIGPRTDPLEVAILQEIALEGRLSSTFDARRAVKQALAPTVDRLVAAGLIRSRHERQRMLGPTFAMFGVSVLGMLRNPMAIEHGPARVLWLIAFAVAFYLAIALCYVPQRGRRATRAIAALRAAHDDLSPSSQPDWTLRGPHAAALGVGLFGVSALWTSAPELASAIGLRPPSSGSDGGGSGCGSGSGSGDGGGGGCGGGGCGG